MFVGTAGLVTSRLASMLSMLCAMCGRVHPPHRNPRDPKIGKDATPWTILDIRTPKKHMNIDY
eukprot:640174-Amphidinium_carterae.1